MNIGEERFFVLYIMNQLFTNKRYIHEGNDVKLPCEYNKNV
jgi:hypothetical protein